MEYVFITLLALAAILYVTYPLFGKQRKLYHLEDVFDFGDTRQLDYLNLKKARIDENMNELDFEFEMGKLSEPDYATIRKGYESEANQVSRSIEGLKTKKDIEESIESEVQSRRLIK